MPQAAAPENRGARLGENGGTSIRESVAVDDAASDATPGGILAFSARLTPQPTAIADNYSLDAGNGDNGARATGLPQATTASQPTPLQFAVPVQPDVTPATDAAAPGASTPSLAAAKPRDHVTAAATNAEPSTTERKPWAEPVREMASEPVAATAPAEHPSGGEAILPRRDAVASREAARPAAEIHVAPETVKPAAARDLRLALGGGDERVEIRVADRSGEIHVAVRTPDPRLAGALRDDLPSLTSRLEAAGLRAETWRPAAAFQDRGRIETSARAFSANSQQQQQGQSGQQKHDDPQPQRPRKTTTSSSSIKPDRKDFQWLFNSLR